MKKKIITKPFDRKKIPPKQNLFLMPLVWLISWLFTRRGRLKIRKTRMEGLKPPFLVISNHLSFADFYIAPLALFPHRANYISELEGFENYGEWIYRQVGCLGTRKFVNDLLLVKNIQKVIDRKGIMVIYPEARYANVGTNSALPISLSKLAKMLNVPIVTINMHGNYLQSPIWNLSLRKEAKLETEIEQIFKKDEIANASISDIHSRLTEHLSYDEYSWQQEKHMRITYGKRAEGLELVLYKCPECETEFRMKTKGAEIFCENCHSKWEMSELGKLISTNKSDDSNKDWHIPDWYEWIRSKVHEEVNSGKYNLDVAVKIEALPNAKNFIDLGMANLKHSSNGFALTFVQYEDTEETTLNFPPESMLSVHTEYDYRSKKGPCITLSELDNTYFLYPRGEGFNPTKIQFATEYLYNLACPTKLS